MARVFLSYRRDDSRHFAGRLADHLGQAPGIDSVFLDSEDIRPGAEFPARILGALEQATHVLVLIGPRWRGGVLPGQQQARLMDPADWVQREVAAALASSAAVIPVLIDGAAMPAAEDLPAPLQALRARQAYAVYPDRALRDELRPLLRQLTGLAEPAPAAPALGRKLAWAGLLGLGVGLLTFLLLSGLLHFGLGLVPEQFTFTADRVKADQRMALLGVACCFAGSISLVLLQLRRHRRRVPP